MTFVEIDSWPSKKYVKTKSKSMDGALLLYVDFSGSDMEKRTDLENKEKGRLRER